jgi:hypothetical protein
MLATVHWQEALPRLCTQHSSLIALTGAAFFYKPFTEFAMTAINQLCRLHSNSFGFFGRNAEFF